MMIVDNDTVHQVYSSLCDAVTQIPMRIESNAATEFRRHPDPEVCIIIIICITNDIDNTPQQ